MEHILLALLISDVPTGYSEAQLLSGLDRPVGLAVASDGRVFLIEQYTGRIRVYQSGSLTTFATVSPVYAGDNETGLLGIALHPNFPTTPYVYVFHTADATTQRVLRYTASGNTASAMTILIDNLPTQGINHDGGGIAFGPDGRLYVSIGDNAVSPSTAQSTTTLAGKILRYNEDGSIPTDNPFGATNPVWCRGLRNTFRIAFRPSTGQLFGTENGPASDDEINLLQAGANYGWPNVSGVAPILSYTPTIAPTGLVFYPGTQIAGFQGNLFFCDYKNGILKRVVLTGDTVQGVTDFVTNQSGMTDVAVGPDGSIYFCRIGGSLWRVTAAGNSAPFGSFTATPSSGSAPLAVTFDASGSSDTDGTIVTYLWNFGDGATGSGVSASHTYTSDGSYTVTLTVTDDDGAAGTEVHTVSVGVTGNQAPAAHIETALPDEGAAPLAVTFEGHGHDNDGTIASLHWDFGDGTTSTDAEFAHVYSSPGTYTVVLTVTDDGGATGTMTVIIRVTGESEGGGGGGGGGCGLLGIESVLLLLLLRTRRPANSRGKNTRIQPRRP